MEDYLNIKINHYSGYVNLTVDNFKKGNYSDASTNARKSAEVACKIIIFHAVNPKMAEDKIKDKSLKDLIQVLIRDRFAERKIINTIEAIQITGNKAAHDNFISKEEASYTLNALNLLTEYLFVGHLKIKKPSGISFDIESKKKDKPVPPKEIEKIVLHEKIVQQTIDKEAEEALITKVQDLQKNERTRYEEQIKKQHEAIQEELNELRRSTQQHTEALVKSKRLPIFKRGALMIAIIFVFVLLIVFYLLVSKNEREKKLTQKSVISLKNDTVYVAINKIKVLQDNPQLEFRIGDVIKTQVQNKSKFYDLPIKVSLVNFEGNELGNDSILLNTAARENYQVVYWGTIYEGSSDSTLLEIKGCSTRDRKFFRNHSVKFRSLADSTFIKEVNDQANTPVYEYCQQHEGAGEFHKLAAILGTLRSYSDENYLAMNDRRVEYLHRAKENTNAILLLRKLIQLQPRFIDFYLRMADAFAETYRYDSAQVYCLKALAISDKYVPTLLNLTTLYMLERKFDSSLIFVKRALEIDQKNKYALGYKNQLEQMKEGDFFSTSEYNQCIERGEKASMTGEYGTALPLFIKATEVDPLSAGAKAEVAQCYFHLGDTSRAVSFLKMANKLDSSDERTILIYAKMAGDIRALFPEADHRYTRALHLHPENLTLLQLASSHYFRLRNFKRCIEIGDLAEKTHTDDRYITGNTAMSALFMRNFTLARSKYEYLNVMAPTDTIMAYLAQTYLEISKGNMQTPEFGAGVKLIKKARDLNPKSSITAGVYNRYLRAIARSGANSSLSTNHKFSMSPSKVQPDASMVIQQKLLYAGKDFTVTGNKNTNTISKRYQNGSQNNISHSRNGSTSRGSRFNNGQGPQKNASFPRGEDVIQAVMENKKLPDATCATFLDVEWNYYNSKKQVSATEANEIAGIRIVLGAAIKKLNEKKK